MVGSAPPERAGAASALSETSSELGGALGIALLGSLGTAVDRRGLAADLPNALPAGAADAVRDTPGGALDVAAALPEPLLAALAHAARAGFVDALHVVAALSTALVLALAILVGLVLRHVARGAEH